MTIAEDYISYKTAVLLSKRKDFGLYASVGYNKKKELITIDISQESFFDGASREYSNSTLPTYEQKWHQQNCPFCIAPTQALVLKWLRLVHNIHIATSRDWESDNVLGYSSQVDDIDGNWESLTYSSPEESIEAAIQYALKSLP